MKKNLRLFILAFLSFQFLQAQDFKFGLKAGLNVNKLAINPEEDWPGPAARPGIHLGGFAQYGLSNNLSIQPELSFSTQGANDEDKDDWQRVKLNYLNLAGVIKYTLDNNIHFSIGPQLGFLTAGEFEKEDKEKGERKYHNASHYLKGTDLSIGFGLGYTLDSGIDLGLRYNHGLSNINNDPHNVAFYESHQTIKSRVFQLSIGYIFNY